MNIIYYTQSFQGIVGLQDLVSSAFVKDFEMGKEVNF